MIAYDMSSRTQESFDAWLAESLGEDHEGYLQTIGEDHLKTLKIDPALGYVPGLKRK